MSVLPITSSHISPTQTIPSKRRLDCVDALRGAACLWVLLDHTFSSMPIPDGVWHYPLDLLVHCSKIGWLGVSLFLVLSGFCLFYPLAVRYNLSEIHLNIATFAKRRAWRILPPYYAALLLLSALEIVTHKYHFGHWDWHIALHNRKDIVLHLLMLHNLSPDTIASVSPAFWSLALESQLYVIFPLLIWCVIRFGLKSILILTFCIAVVWQSLCYQHFGFSMGWPTNFAVYYHALPGRCFEFAVGMVAASFVARPRQGQSRIALMLILVPLLPALYFVLKVSRFGPLCDQIWGIIFAATLVLLSRIPNFWFERNFVLRCLVWIGAISYSIYLIHQPFINLITTQRMYLPQSHLGDFTAGFIRIPLLIGIGYLFHLAFERPFMPGRPRTERQAEIAAIISPAP
jgi:peptidoglycan/LPS O-acetylase OafA/YrhL